VAATVKIGHSLVVLQGAAGAQVPGLVHDRRTRRIASHQWDPWPTAGDFLPKRSRICLWKNWAA